MDGAMMAGGAIAKFLSFPGTFFSWISTTVYYPMNTIEVTTAKAAGQTFIPMQLIWKSWIFELLLLEVPVTL